ncbi:MAG: hypothetical protein COB77_05935 [Gammaproteobacteria bacterium]|nr:MAG: hypothetical protein COB77_05935 [Gammaproteobacteria bacterium]
MEEKKQLSIMAEKAHREETKAYNEMYSDEQKANKQREQLETCLDYREECLSGLKSAKSSGLSIVQIRECQLLVKYLDTVVETRQYQSDICDENYDKSKKIWNRRNEHYEKLKDEMKNLDTVKDADVMVDDSQETDNSKPSSVKTYKTYYD